LHLRFGSAPSCILHHKSSSQLFAPVLKLFILHLHYCSAVCFAPSLWLSFFLHSAPQIIQPVVCTCIKALYLAPALFLSRLSCTFAFAQFSLAICTTNQPPICFAPVLQISRLPFTCTLLFSSAAS
jgi:hypothetical protein